MLSSDAALTVSGAESVALPMRREPLLVSAPAMFRIVPPAPLFGVDGQFTAVVEEGGDRIRSRRPEAEVGTNGRSIDRPDRGRSDRFTSGYRDVRALRSPSLRGQLAERRLILRSDGRGLRDHLAFDDLLGWWLKRLRLDWLVLSSMSLAQLNVCSFLTSVRSFPRLGLEAFGVLRAAVVSGGTCSTIGARIAVPSGIILTISLS